MQVAEPLVRSWKARLELGFTREGERSVLSRKQHDGPLVVQKPLYPEGEAVCHAIVVHPPGGIAGGDELELSATVAPRAAALLTTPGAAKWYRSSGAQASQRIAFDVQGGLEWLPQETIVFDGALAQSGFEADLAPEAGLIGWDIVCLGRVGSGERFRRGSYRFSAQVRRAGKPLWLERGRIDGGGAILQSPAGLAGHSVFGTLFCTFPGLAQEHLQELRKTQPEEGRGAVTQIPAHLHGILLARYLGDSSEAARRYFTALWRVLRPALAGREAIEPRIWRT